MEALAAPGTPSEDTKRTFRVRAFIQARETMFALEVFYLVALLTAAATYIYGVYSLPGSLGTVPLGVPWFGALGAVIISLTGTVTHAKDWDATMAYWHISRPLVGASTAVVAVLIMQAGLTAVGSGPQDGVVSNPGSTHNVLYYVVAFAVGYRESTFRQLLARVIDVILNPGPPPVRAAHHAVLTISPTQGPRAGGTPLDITGSGLAATTAVSIGGVAANFKIISDSHLNVVTPPGANAGQVPVTVTAKTGSVSAPEFTYT